MAGIPKYLLTRSITPGWVFTVEALILTLLVHGVLFFLADYQPGRRTSPLRQSPGVTLLTSSGVPKEEWSQLLAWTEVHNPAQISRSDAGAGYAALLRKHRPRSVGRAENEPGALLLSPALPSLPGYATLATVASAEPELYLGDPFEERISAPIPVVKRPFVMDGNGERLTLRRLFVPKGVDGKEILRPTIVSTWGSSGMMRNHLVQSCGVTALDRAALEAVAGERFDSRETIVVYWPEMELQRGEMP